MIDETKLFSTMDKARGPVEKIYYGQDDMLLYFAFKGDIKRLCECDRLNIWIDCIEESVSVDLNPFKEYGQFCHSEKLEIELACESWLEFSINKDKFEKRVIKIRFELIKDNIIVQTLPGFGEIDIDIESDHSDNWFI